MAWSPCSRRIRGTTRCAKQDCASRAGLVADRRAPQGARIEFRRGPDDPLAPIAVNTASMPHQLVDLELEALADVRRTGLEIGVEEDAAIAVALAFEAQRHLEIFVILVGLQVSVFFGDGLSVNGSVLDGPLFVPYFDPAAEVMAVEQLDPLLIRQLHF